MRRAAVWASVVLGVLVTGLWAQSGGPSEGIVFGFKPRPGEALRHRITMKSVGTIGVGAGLPGARFTQSTTQEIVERCREVRSDGSAVVEMSLERIATRMNTAGMVIEYDSQTFDAEKAASPVGRLIGRVYSGLIGAKVEVTFSAQGSPVKVSGLREAVSRAVAAVKEELGQDMTGRFAGQIIDGVATMFDDETFADQMKSFYRFVPTKAGAVAVGEKWLHDWTMKLAAIQADCSAHGDYELLGVEDYRGRRCAKIGIQESFRMAGEGSPPLAVPMPHANDVVVAATVPAGGARASQPGSGLGRMFENMDITLRAGDSEGSGGTAWWDYESGVLVELRQTQHIVIDVRIRGKDRPTDSQPAASGPAAGLTSATITQNFTTSVQIDLLEDEQKSGSTGPASTGGVR